MLVVGLWEKVRAVQRGRLAADRPGSQVNVQSLLTGGVIDVELKETTSKVIEWENVFQGNFCHPLESENSILI